MFGEIPIVWVALVVLVLFGGIPASIAMGRRVKQQAQGPGGSGTSSPQYYLTITLILIVALACLLGGMFLFTSFR